MNQFNILQNLEEIYAKLHVDKEHKSYVDETKMRDLKKYFKLAMKMLQRWLCMKSSHFKPATEVEIEEASYYQNEVVLHIEDPLDSDDEYERGMDCV